MVAGLLSLLACYLCWLAISAGLLSLLLFVSGEAMDYPETKPKPVTDEYHGIPVQDSYRWLENPDDPAVKEWTRAQNRTTRTVLDAIPVRQQLFDRLKALYTATSSDYYDLRRLGGKLFAMKLQPPKQQSLLVTLASADDLGSEAVLLDPNELDPSGDTAIDFYAPSLDGRLAAICLSQGGSEDGSVYIYDAASGKPLPDLIPRVNYPTAGGSVAWNADGSGFYYTRYPRGDERPPEDMNFYQQVYFHQLGSPSEEDQYVIGEQFPRIAEIELHASQDGRYLLANVKNGDGGEVAHYVMSPDSEWTQVTRFEDQIQEAVIGPDEHLYMLSRRDAPRGSILRIPLHQPSLDKAQVVVPEREGAISHFEPAENLLYVVEMDGGPTQLFVFDHHGKEMPPVPVEPISSIWQIVPLGDDRVLYRSGSFITPPAWFEYDPRSGQSRRTSLFVTSPASFEDCEVVREFAISRDGTRVPVNLILPKGARRNGDNPLLLTGYGGYGISLTPYFNIRRRVWLDEGGIIAVANLRGGGEYGEEWHKGGNLTNKQNVFDDFIACARHLIERGYTSREKLCIEGGSNGGLLMGAAFTQQPELFRAVITHVGLYDMLRVELDPNGAFNVTEFGTVTVPQHFEALYDYSPYHRVQDGVRYPAVLLTTGENDGRVNPMQSRKMAARLQAATGSGHPVLLRTSSAGHGIGTALGERIAEDSDVFAFLFDQIGAGGNP
jgi:prolyl oligopeptidase